MQKKQKKKKTKKTKTKRNLDIIEFQDLKVESVLFYHFNFERNYDVLKSNSPYILLNKNINFNKDETGSKIEDPSHIFREMKLVFQLI